MYTMKEACNAVGMSYEALKFYCNQGLVPNVKRDHNNHRIFDERDINWIKSLTCLKNCGMTLQEMKTYLALCLEGPSSIPQRKKILAVHRKNLEERLKEIHSYLDYIDWKQQFYSDVLDGKAEYFSYLLPLDEESPLS